MTQWYELNPSLYRDEVEVMKMRFPDSKLGKLDDGRLYWLITFRTIASTTCPDGYREWNVMIVYNSDHPDVSSGRRGGAGNYTDSYGGSVKVYPLSPSVKDMQEMYRNHGRGYVPHLLCDEFGNFYLCIEHNDKVESGSHRGERVTCAADYAAQTARWLTAFELSLTDDAVLEKFSKHTDNN